MNKLSLWSKVITETETSKMNKNNEIMKKEIDECIKFKKQQVEIIEKKKKEEQEQKKKEEQEKKLKYEKAKNEQEKLEKEKALKLKQENEIKIKEQEEKIKKEAQKNKAPVNDSLTSIKSSSAVEEAQLYLNEIKKIKNEIRPAVKENKEWKNQTLKLKLRINTRVIQISSTKESVNEISTDLNNILNQGKQISTEVYYWLMDFLAKAIMVNIYIYNKL